MNAGTKEPDCETRARLLDAAGRVFAERGFNGASVRDICKAARANVAAVNYHFGGKAGLYSQVVAHWAAVARQKYPMENIAAPRRAPEERLRDFVRTILNRMLDEERPLWHARLMAQEMASPTAAFDGVVKAFYRPTIEHLRQIIREILGRKANDEKIDRVTFSIMGQCFYYLHARRIIELMSPEFPRIAKDAGKIAEHIIEFSLPGLRQLARKKRTTRK